MNKDLHKGIWVYAEHKGAVLSEATLELLTKALELKEACGEEITALLLGNHVKAMADTLIAYGADRVIVVDNPDLEEYMTRPYAEVVASVVEKYKPNIFLLSATTTGRDLAPRVMAKLGTGLTADCLDLSTDKTGVLVQTKPSYGGNIMCTITIPEHRPQMATVRPKVFEIAPPCTERTGICLEENVHIRREEDVEILGITTREKSGKSIEEAEIIVAGGRGLKDKKDLEVLEELATLVKGQVGCTRPLVDEGWMSHEGQIGQSGNTVKPKFIINVGISGAVQYIVGMEKAECILSINQNEAADIFNISSYGAVVDYSELLPAVIEEIKNRR